MGKKIFLVILFLILLGMLIWSGTRPFSERTWFLEVIFIFVGSIILVTTYRKFTLTTLSYVILFVLFIFMTIGAHYSYARVPLFDWIKDQYDLQRNDYDRMGHFIKGFFVIVLREVLLRTSPLIKGKWLFFISTSMILAMSALYEIVEIIASFMFENGSVKFLEMQGDIWDSEWDMGFAYVGAIIAYWTLSKLHNRLLQK
jgi:putative membrane protein